MSPRPARPISLPPSPLPGYAAQLENLRSAAKWLVTAFAGVGGILVVGLQLANIGRLSASSGRLYVALAAAAIGLAAVAFMIKEASAVLTYESLTLADLSDKIIDQSRRRPGRNRFWHWRNRSRSEEISRIQDKIARSRHELYGYAGENVGDLHRLLREADERGWRTRRPGPAVDRSSLARQAARDVVQYANYHATLDLFRKMRGRLAWCAAVVALSSGVFAYASNPPMPDGPVRVQIDSGK